MEPSATDEAVERSRVNAPVQTRREFLAVATGAAVLANSGVLHSPLQQSLHRTLGILWFGNHTQPNLQGTLEDQLKASPKNWSILKGTPPTGVGNELSIEFAHGHWDLVTLQTNIETLLTKSPHVILAGDSISPQVARYAVPATIPVVMAVHGDPPGIGLGTPTDNFYGIRNLSVQLAHVRLMQLRAQVMPNPDVAVLMNPISQSAVLQWKAMKNPFLPSGVRLAPSIATDATELANALAALAATLPKPKALFVLSDPLMTHHLKGIADWANTNSVKVGFAVPDPEVCEKGATGYGPDRFDLMRRAADMVHILLLGGTPPNKIQNPPVPSGPVACGPLAPVSTSLVPSTPAGPSAPPPGPLPLFGPCLPPLGPLPPFGPFMPPLLPPF